MTITPKTLIRLLLATVVLFVVISVDAVLNQRLNLSPSATAGIAIYFVVAMGVVGKYTWDSVSC